MPTRRDFLKQTAAAGVAVATSVQVAQAAEEVGTGERTPMKANKLAHSAASRIQEVFRREETTLRLGGDGDNFHMSWTADDRQLVAVCDGMGWFEKSKGRYNSRLWAITGGPQNATFQDIPGYPELISRWAYDVPRYYGFGTLALDGRIYQFLSTWNHAIVRPDGSLWTDDLRFTGAKLIYSPDNGRTWCNQDGSTPVVWESWERRSRQTMVFFEEPQDAFSLLTILQMGRNYAANRDGYVYVYAPNGNTEGTMNELVMFRVPKEQLLHRGAYEYFADRRPDGTAAWVKDITARGIVHTFPRGWVNTGGHPYAWHPSVVYNAPLALYLMANWGMGTAADGGWFAKPSYLGFWVAQNPWGPWTQIHEETAWTPAEDPAARAYQPQIAPKWIAADGKSFWLVWTDYHVTDEEAFRRMKEAQRIAATPDDRLREELLHRRAYRYYAFNIQRVDLILK